MPKAFPAEFRRDVVAVARRKEAPLGQTAKDFGISDSCLHRWVKRAEIEDGFRDGLTLAEGASGCQRGSAYPRRTAPRGPSQPSSSPSGPTLPHASRPSVHRRARRVPRFGLTWGMLTNQQLPRKILRNGGDP